MYGTSGEQNHNTSDIQAMEKAWDEATETDLVRTQIAINSYVNNADYITNSLRLWKKPLAAQNVKSLSPRQS